MSSNETFAYDLRLQILSMAVDIHRYAVEKEGSQKGLKTQDILETAHLLNDFVSNGSRKNSGLRFSKNFNHDHEK